MRSPIRNALIAILLAAGLALPSMATDRDFLAETLKGFGGDSDQIDDLVQNELTNVEVDALNQALRDSVANGRTPQIDETILADIIAERMLRGEELSRQELRALVKGYEMKAHFDARADWFDAQGKTPQADRFRLKADRELSKFRTRSGVPETTVEVVTIEVAQDAAQQAALDVARRAARQESHKAVRIASSDTVRKAARDAAKAERSQAGKALAKGKNK